MVPFEITPMLAIDLVYGPYGHVFWWWFTIIVILALIFMALEIHNEHKKRYPDYKEKIGITVCLIAFFSVILLVVVNIWAFFQPSEEDLLAKEKAKQEQAQAQLLQQEIDDKKQKEKKVYEEKFSEFKNQEGQQIQSAITDLELLEEGLAERINSLELLIKEAGREPNEDADLNQWKDHLSKVQMNLKNLEESLKDAFLQYQKFKLTATAGEQKAFEQAIETGSADAQEIVGRYDELKQQLSGEKEED